MTDSQQPCILNMNRLLNAYFVQFAHTCIVLKLLSTWLQAGQALAQARRPKQGAKPWVMKGKKRSEVDRRLDILVGPAGKIKDGSTAAVIGMLRLFNLCDVAPLVTQADVRRPDREARAASPVPPRASAQVRFFTWPFP